MNQLAGSFKEDWCLINAFFFLHMDFISHCRDINSKFEMAF